MSNDQLTNNNGYRASSIACPPTCPFVALSEDGSIETRVTRHEQRLNMQNKPNFKNAKIDISSYKTRGYDIFCRFSHRKNKPNSKPICVKIGNFKSITSIENRVSSIKHQALLYLLTKKLPGSCLTAPFSWSDIRDELISPAGRPVSIIICSI